jgi:uncharacterized membrane protein
VVRARMAHLSEERDIRAPPQAIWRVVSDTSVWPRFYATPQERLHLRSVELLDPTRGVGGRRRMHFLGVPAWEEEVTQWRENEFVAWVGVRNPGLKYWQQQLELMPHKAGYTTLRWDVYFSMGGPRAFRRWFGRTMEDILLSSLERVEKLAVEVR